MPFLVTDEAIGSFNERCQKISQENADLAFLNALIDEFEIKYTISILNTIPNQHFQHNNA